jgi:SAM-dependent methyltransferase
MSASEPSTSRSTTDDWETHWKSYSATNSANPAQAYRRMLIFDALALPAARPPVRLLELGCGQGDFARDVLSAYPDVEICGLDLASAGVEAARQRVPQGTFLQQDLTQPLALPDRFRGWATHAVCSEVLEHVDDPVAVLRNIRSCLAPGCRLVITVPAGPMSAFDRHIGHRRHFSPGLLDQVLRTAGFDVADLRGAGFPFFNLYRLAVVARGEALIRDAAGGAGESLPLTARAAIRLFSGLFRLNTARGQRGWQLVAVGVAPDAGARAS